MSVDDLALLGDVQRIYREASGSLRVPRPEDLLNEDLDVNSLLAIELLVALEDLYDIELVNDPRALELRSVKDLIELVNALRAAGRPSTERSHGDLTVEADGR